MRGESRRLGRRPLQMPMISKRRISRCTSLFRKQFEKIIVISGKLPYSRMPMELPVRLPADYQEVEEIPFNPTEGTTERRTECTLRSLFQKFGDTIGIDCGWPSLHYVQFDLY